MSVLYYSVTEIRALLNIDSIFVHDSTILKLAEDQLYPKYHKQYPTITKMGDTGTKISFDCDKQ